MLRKCKSLTGGKFAFISDALLETSRSISISKPERNERIFTRSAPSTITQAVAVSHGICKRPRSIDCFESFEIPSVTPIANRNCQANGLKNMNKLCVGDAV